MSGLLPPRRRLLVLMGNVCIASGLGLGLTALAILAFGSPVTWPQTSQAILGDLRASSVADADAVVSEARLHEAGDTSSSDVLATPSPPQPVPPDAVPLSTERRPTLRPVPAATEAKPSPARPTVAAVTIAPRSDPPYAQTPFLPITRMVIPRLDLETDVAPAHLSQLEGGITWEVPAFLAGHAEGTAGAGAPGTAVLLGHVTSRAAGSVFRDLGQIEAGDQIQIFSDEQEFRYRVADVRTVSRTDVSILQPMQTAGLSLITCAGAWIPLLQDYTQRLVVHAELDGPPAAPPTASVGSAVELPGTAQPVPVARSTPNARAELHTLLVERFTEPRDRWPNEPLGTARFEDGTYVLSAREPGRFVAVGAPIAGPLDDVVVTARLRKAGGPPGGGYGVIVRDQDPDQRDGVNQGGRYYVLEVGDRGEVGIWRRDDDRWIDLLPWTPSNVVHTGTAPNELTVRAVGPRLTLEVNGVVVAELHDPSLSAGGVGVFVGGDFNEVRLEHLIVQTLS